MMDSDVSQYTIKEILKTEVAPALGCTEPVAIALCAASAASVIQRDRIDHVEIWVDPNIYKNGMAVVIPGTDGLHGLDLAAAIGALGGDPELRLEVLETITPETVKAARRMIEDKKIKVNLLENHKGLLIRSKIKSGKDTSECTIRDLHDNIVSLVLNNEPVTDSPILTDKKVDGNGNDVRAMETWLQNLTLSDLIGLVEHLDDDDLAFLEEGVRHNLRLAEYGLKHGSGLGIGKTLERLVRQKLLKRDMIAEARILTSAASDARMSGVKMPAMSSAGSGNHGLTATLPIWAVKDYVECSHRTILEAVGLSHVITAYIKIHTGRLSAVCGCSIAAGAGATAGITYLMGGDIQHIAGAIMNITEDLAGVICDGAKAGCSLKLATAAGTAVQSALFSLHGVHVQSTDGIMGTSPEKTMQNIGELSTDGMIETDRTILKIMLEKHFSHVNDTH